MLEAAAGHYVLMLSATAAENPLRMKAIGTNLRLFTSGYFWKWVREMGAEESRWGGVVRLMQLESEVLAKLWPADRVVCGQMVCRSLRANLRLSKHVVLKARKKCSVLDLAAANFAQYKGRDVSLSLDSK